MYPLSDQFKCNNLELLFKWKIKNILSFPKSDMNENKGKKMYKHIYRKRDEYVPSKMSDLIHY